jgi:hypothetical protein
MEVPRSKLGGNIHYTPEGRGFDSRCDHLIFLTYVILPAAPGAEADRATDSIPRPARKAGNLTAICEPIF